MGKQIDVKSLSSEALANCLMIVSNEEDAVFVDDVIKGRKELEVRDELVRRAKLGEKLLKNSGWEDFFPGPDPRPNPDDFQVEEKT